MANIQLTINRKSEDAFEFTIYRNAPAGELEVERAEMVRIMDEATDALMRQSQKLECEQLNSSSPVHRIKIYAGGDAVNK